MLYKRLMSIWLLAIGLAACSQPVATPPPVMESTAEATATSDEAQDQATPTQPASQCSLAVFGVYLVEQDVSLRQMKETNLSEIRLEDKPLLTVDDIVTYSWDTHEMQLTASASQRVARFERSRLSMAGLPFVICAGGEPIYGGALWTSYSSATYDGIVIDVYPAESGQPLPIRLGYPTPEWFTGEDLRSDPRIQRSLEEAGMLR